MGGVRFEMLAPRPRHYSLAWRSGVSSADSVYVYPLCRALAELIRRVGRRDQINASF